MTVVYVCVSMCGHVQLSLVRTHAHTAGEGGQKYY